MTERLGIIINGELQVFNHADQIVGTGFEGEPFVVPEGYPNTMRWRDGAFEAIARSLPARQVYSQVFTIAERAWVRRLQTETWGAGHALEGHLKDPDGLVQVMVDSMLASDEVIAADSQTHANGVQLLVYFSEPELGRGLAPNRIPQILAMDPAPAS